LSNPALAPFDHGVSPGWYTSAAADRANQVIYVANINGNGLNRFDPAANTLTPLAGNGYSAYHSSLAYIPGITLTKTVGTEPGVCATASEITVAPGTTVYYCYTITNNTSDRTFTLHDLVDDQLGTIFTGLNYTLTPGSSVSTVAAGLSLAAVITTTTTNTATWTAYNAAAPDPISARASATVNVGQSVEKVPTLSEWGMIFMSLMLVGTAIWMMRRRQTS